jgi:hypothetical protein
MIFFKCECNVFISKAINQIQKNSIRKTNSKNCTTFSYFSYIFAIKLKFIQFLFLAEIRVENKIENRFKVKVTNKIV